MTLPGSSATVGTPGDVVATHTISSKEYQVIMTADPDGHIHGTAAAYIFTQMPRALTASATDFFDVFNATGSAKIIRLRGLYPVIESTGAWTQGTTIRFDLFRTSAVGTSGTTATENAAAPAAGAGRIYRLSTVDSPTLNANITIRTLPTGGATAAGYMFSIYIQPEETNPASNLLTGINFFPQLPYNPAFELQENEGFKVRQITTAGTLTGASFGWILSFAVIP